MQRKLCINTKITHFMKKILIFAVAAFVMLACADKNQPSDKPWGADQMTFQANSAEFKMSYVKAADYKLVIRERENDADSVTVTGSLSDYYIGQTEVTNGLWAAVMGSKPAGQANDGDNYPVAMVTYYDVMRADGFLAKLNAMLKDQLPAGKQFRLPTDMQWQYAHDFGMKEYDDANLENIGWFASNADNTTHPVAQKQANALGLYDMYGNVWEWTRDNYLELEELPASQGKDYCASNNTIQCVKRGGGYRSKTPLYLRANDMMVNRLPSIGFRVVLADAAQEAALVEPPTAENVISISAQGVIAQYFNMVEVKGGNYSITLDRNGSEETISGTLSDYYICDTEIENGVWYAVMGSKPEGQTKDANSYPVSNVTYEDITKPGGFLDKLNELVKDQLPTGKKLALPTEAEWHYAAMGGQKSKGYTYAGSNTVGDVAWYKDNSNGAAHAVASKFPNELGIYDMSGNVWEWTDDKKDDTSAYSAGGSWTSDAKYNKVNSTWCESGNISQGGNNKGFRLVLR